MSDRTKIGELAFEDFTDNPPELWRVTSWRYWHNRRFRHTNWFATEAAARKHAEWIAGPGCGEVISVAKYVRQEP